MTAKTSPSEPPLHVSYYEQDRYLVRSAKHRLLYYLVDLESHQCGCYDAQFRPRKTRCKHLTQSLLVAELAKSFCALHGVPFSPELIGSGK